MAASTATSPDAVASGGGSGGRAIRLPRWTHQEMLVLVRGKAAHERGLLPAPRPRSAEPKWSAVSAYCLRRGVERGPLQCRKRWSNLACDFKKIKRWEGECVAGEGSPSFWEMRSDVRRERKLPGFFDREAFELMDGAALGLDGREEEEEEVFDSGRSAREEEPPLLVSPLSEKKYQPFENEHSDPGNSNDKQQTDTNPEKGSSSWEGQKRRRTSEEGLEETNFENKLIQVLERNGKIISDHLEAQNINCQLDRDQRNDQVDGLIGILTKLADSLGRIADKL